MKHAWETKKLGEVCRFVRGPFGGSLKKNCFEPDGFAVYEQQHAIYNQFSDIRYFINEMKFQEMKRFEILSGELLMSCSGTIGKVAIVPNHARKGIINQALLKLTPAKSLNVNYLKYWMESEDFQESISIQSQGVAIKNVASVKVLKEIYIPYPSLPEQRRIVAILDTCFQAIDKAKANVECNLQNAKDLFQSQLNEIFTKKGDGWVEKKLSDITSVLGDGLHGTPRYTEDGEYYFVNGNNLDNGKIVFKTKTKRVSIDQYIKYKKNLNENTILVSINGTLGNVAFYNNEKIILGKSACYFNLTEQANKHFIKYIILSPYFVKYAHSVATGATIKNVSLKSMRDFRFNIPEIAAQESIVDKLDSLQVQTKFLESKYQQELDALDELKKSILQKAFNGELTETEEAAA